MGETSEALRAAESSFQQICNLHPVMTERLFATDRELILSAVEIAREALKALRALPTTPSPEERWSDGGRALPCDRETLGRMVREAWVRWAETQPVKKASWLVPYDELAEPDKEADRQIGEAVARWTLIHAAAQTAFTASPDQGSKP